IICSPKKVPAIAIFMAPMKRGGDSSPPPSVVHRCVEQRAYQSRGEKSRFLDPPGGFLTSTRPCGPSLGKWREQMLPILRKGEAAAPSGKARIGADLAASECIAAAP